MELKYRSYEMTSGKYKATYNIDKSNTNGGYIVVSNGSLNCVTFSPYDDDIDSFIDFIINVRNEVKNI